MKSPDEKGFTLVELMIALTISGIVMASVYTAYITQQKSSIVQEQVVEMQQNIRAAINLMTMEIQMAGYDPTGEANASFVTATAGRLRFTRDSYPEPDGDGDTLDEREDVEYGFPNADDNDHNGVVDSGTASLGTNSRRSPGSPGGGFQPIADDIAAVEFCYRLEGDGEADPCTTTPGTNQLDQIREVQISILARASKIDRKFTNNKQYVTASGATWGPFNDNYRRRLLITTVQCRNMGLK